MGRRLVRQPNGKLAIFSSIVDDFILLHASPEDVVFFRIEEELRDTKDRAEKWVQGTQPGRMIWDADEMLDTIERVHGKAKADERRAQMSEPCTDSEYDDDPVIRYSGEGGSGLSQGSFVDVHKRPCSISNSSLAGRAAIWLGTDGERMLLTRGHVLNLLPLLIGFALDGELPDLSKLPAQK